MKTPGSFDDLLPVKDLLEIRFPKAHEYWDVSGNLTKEIATNLTALEPIRCGPTGFEFAGAPDCGLLSATFGWDRMGIEIDMEVSLDRSAPMASAFWSSVARAFHLDRLERIGNRYLYLFPTETEDAAEVLLADRAIWSLSDSLRAFGETEVRGAALRTLLRSDDRRVRLEITIGKATIRGKRHAGVFLDLDLSTVSDPQARDVDIDRFLKWNRRFVRDHLHEILRVTS